MNYLRKFLALEGGKPVRTEAWPAAHEVDEDDEYLLLSVLRSGIWSSGPMTTTFEREFAQFCGAKHCLLVHSGTAALKLALQAVGIGPGDEVILPGMTWPSVAVAVLECGAVPIPVDVNLETLSISRPTIESAITPRTKAIIPTHLFSSQSDLPPIIELASARKLNVIEDCAHAIGARRFGRVLGTFGQAGVFSFNQKKLLACGEGGCLVTDSTELFENAEVLRQIKPFVRPKNFLPSTYQASEFQAAVLLSQLRKLPARLAFMEERAEQLRCLLTQIGDVFPLSRLSGTDCQTFYNFCFRVQGVDIQWFRKALAAELNLPMSGGYPPLTEAPALDMTNEPRFKEHSLNTDLANCRIAHYQQAVRFRHHALMTNEESIVDIARAIRKVREAI
jgi:L-glutamine:2-deoxy-scyllo-inosose/3-amino-2,3-dideoxy-scyllo-inosose aminotransferase